MGCICEDCEDRYNAAIARVAELTEHNEGMEKLIDHLIETCPEAKPIILAWVVDHLKPKP